MTMQQIMIACSIYFSVSVDDIKGQCRKRELVKARHSFYYLSRMLTTATLSYVGYFAGGRDHTTVMHGVNAVKVSLELQDDYLFPHLDNLIQLLPAS